MAKPPSSSFERMLENNVEWAKEVEDEDPGFFNKSAKGQKPHTLWFGCSDSRVPESVITKSRPGDIFVHRNIANQVLLYDSNAISVLDYAVNHVGVENVVVVGHTHCGGVTHSLKVVQNGTAATLPHFSPALNQWLSPLIRFISSISIPKVDDPLTFLIEENVKNQVENVWQTETMQRVLREGKGPKGNKVRVHGWIYELETGHLRDLNVTRGPP
ncbi:hypothetical protein AMATHDRAFT_50480 [Amanita thiersii Skay4041]|uniref:Carbonic anhydrase n=1 Tax=Amanita thiersii Skay4041 TaxID=703135 RepID=A0A2A9NHK4_9AGAR|nr:hypothetical protein AMATHDRAFT_50480 [Amanita thiersii Skay4041]